MSSGQSSSTANVAKDACSDTFIHGDASIATTIRNPHSKRYRRSVMNALFGSGL